MKQEKLFAVESTQDQEQEPKTEDELTYTAESIEILEGLEPVRKRPGMYLGDTDSCGLTHMLEGAIGRAFLDVFAAPHGRMELTLHADGSASTSDNGAGSLSTIHQGRTLLEHSMTSLWVGNPWEPEAQDAYKTIYGHDMPVYIPTLSIINALSTKVTVSITRAGKRHQQHYLQGQPQEATETPAPADLTGTSLRFWPDRSIISPQATYLRSTIETLCHNITKHYKQLQIRLVDNRTPTRTEIFFECGQTSQHNAKPQSP